MRTFIAALLLATTAAAEECSQSFDSTFDAVQKLIFERRGCTSVTCHVGAQPAGNLDLSAGVAWDNLIDAPAETVSTAQYPGLARVVPGNKKRSLLWLNLAAASQPSEWRAPLRAMPLGGLPPLTSDELALVQLWIEYGATRTGVAPGSAELADACLPPLEPLKIEPLAPLPPGVGVQIRAPHQMLPPLTERETCFVSYFDVSDQVPEKFRGPGDTFRFKRVDARQDPLSHHGVVIVYRGRASIDDPIWGPFACRGGARDGEPCAPRDADACGGDAICASPPMPSVACIGYGPGDADIGTGEETLFSTMSSAVQGAHGIYDEAPLRGILVWNSHAFNVAAAPATLDMWVNFEFADPAEQLHRLDRFVDVSAIGKMRVPPFTADEVCEDHVLPPDVRVTEFVSHTHKRGKRFRVFEGDWRCEDGPRAGDSCSPLGPDVAFETSDLCAGARCVSQRTPKACDCNFDLAVTIDELIVAVQLALGDVSGLCRRADADGDGAVRVGEIIAGVAAALNPGERDPQASLLYTSLTYADPLVLNFEPPRFFGPPDSLPVERTVTYCGLYDNGYTNPDEVKRRSRVPSNAGPCPATHCAEGLIGEPCTSDEQCDTSPGAGDGSCDACSVGFGLTTDDEMFVFIGSYIENSPVD